VADLERAVCLSDANVIPPGDWSRLYFGAEFCPWRFPSLESLSRFVAIARQSGLPVTIMTPVLNETFLPRFRAQMEALLPLLSEGDELLASDLGTIHFVRQLSSEVTLVAGRVLSGQKRGPRILDLDLNDAERDYFQQGRWYQTETLGFLAEQSIERVELDNLLQGIAALPKPLTGSLHLPYAMVTSSRNCPVRTPGEYGVCSGGCDTVLKLKNSQTALPLFQAGNTQFLKNPEPPADLSALRIDRIVEHMVLPG
jgi:hypothetical protein